MKPVAAYCRVSGRRQQTDRWSLPAQRDAILTYCQGKQLPEPTWYIETHSAKSDDADARPVFRQLLNDAKRFSAIVVVDLDRFARSVVAGLTAAARLEQAGCRVVSLHDADLDLSTPDGELTFTLKLMVSRYENKQRGRRTKAGRDQAKAAGRWVDQPPYGARIGDDGRLALNPDTSPVLGRILREATTASFSRIADGLSADGIPAPGARRSPAQWGEYSGHWWPAQVSYMIRNADWLLDFPEPWPTLWLAANARPRMPRIRSDRPAHMLTGLMRCRCGAVLLYGARSRDGQARYAQCNARRLRVGGAGCPYPRTYCNVYEEQVLAQLLALPSARRRRAVQGEATDIAALRQLQADRAAVWQAYHHDHMIDRPQYEAEVRALKAREAALPRPSATQIDLGPGFDALRAAFPQLPAAEQNALLRQWIEYVAIDGRAATVVFAPQLRAACKLPEPGPWPPTA